MNDQTNKTWMINAIVSSIDGFFEWNLKDGKTIFSPTLKRMLGFAVSELENDNKSFFQDFIHPEDRDSVIKLLRETFSKAKDSFSSEFRVKTKSGLFYWVKLNGRIQRDANGKPISYLGVVTNINEYKTSGGSSSQSQFIAQLNHELRTPLASIISLSKLLFEEKLTETQKGYTHNIFQSANMLLTLVNDILDFSRLSAGKLPLEHAPFDIVEAVNETIEMVKPLADKKSLYIKTNFQDKLPQCVMGDQVRIKQIFINLCTNAVKFTKTGGFYINIKYSLIDKKTAKFTLEVVDTGIGIPQEKLPLLFQEYMQANVTTSREYGGTGLGLSICKKLVELMGGKIFVKSQEGIGTTFWFEVPLDLSNEADVYSSLQLNSTEKSKAMWEAELIQENGSISGETRSNKTPSKGGATKNNASLQSSYVILIAEDNAVNMAVMQGLLKSLGYTNFMTAENGKEAVEAHKASPAHIILMDVNMPLLDGVEATQEIRKFDKNVPIVAVTANSLNEEKVRCLSVGMSEFTTKPVNKEKLHNILSTYLMKEPQRELKKMHAESEIVLVNVELLQGFITDLGKEKVIEFINLYKKDAPGFIQKLEKNVDLETASHTLAGMSENLNFIALGRKSREILQIVRSKKGSDKIVDLIKELAPLYESTLNEANKIISESSPS